MCGICGKYSFNRNVNIQEELIRKMCAVLEHRGPDDEGVYTSKNIGLGHRRLSIIDLSTGHQPMCNENGKIWIVLNGEIYNFVELRDELKKKGHRFKTNSDTEVILHQYEEDGVECVEKLRGMFAFAIWDGNNERLFLARDRLGQKPLVYSVSNGSLIFGSEIKAILEDPSVKKSVNTHSLHNYLTYQYVPAPETMFKNIRKLPPAHILVCEKGNIKVERYWQISYANKTELDEEECCREIMRLLKEATKIRLISDVPLGAFLSGGIDSSAIVGLMSQLMDQPVKTFSIGFEEQSFNELEYASKVSKLFSTNHKEFIVKPDAIEILPKLIWHYNEPFADSSAIPTYYVSKMTRKYVTVALNGDAGDENFAGYPRYLISKLANWYDRIPGIIREKVIGKLVGCFPGAADRVTIIRKLKLFFKYISESPELRYTQWISYFDNESKDKMYSPEFRDEVKSIDSTDWLLNIFSDSDGKDFLDSILFADMNSYLPEDLLVKVDIATMANSLEGRSPFLDHKFIEFAASIPSNLKLKGNSSKYILKKALAELLPHEILHRKKMGFGVPIDSWFRNQLKDYVYDVLLDPGSLNRGYFNKNAIKKLLDDHSSAKVNYGYRIWALLNLELWHKMFFDGEPPNIM